MSTSESIALVILNWNGKKLLEKFLPTLLKNSEGAKVYIADNASSDDSKAWVDKHYPTVAWIQNDKNYGFAEGYNQALKHIDAEIYCLVNSDIEVSEGWLNPIRDLFKKEEKCAAIQPKIRSYKHPDHFEYAGAAGGFVDALGYAYCRGRLFDQVEKDDGQYDNELRQIFWATGACLFVRSKAYWEVGGLDANFFAHYEEIDFCWRLQHSGHWIGYAKEAVVYHVGGATLSHQKPQKTYLNFRNSLFTLCKNLPSSKVVTHVVLRMILDAVAFARVLTQGKAGHAWAILRAHGAFYLALPRLLRQRKALPKKKTDYAHSNSLVWQFFVKKRRKFAELR